MTRQSAAEFREATRNQALLVARRQLTTIGWDNVTMTGMAAEMGVSRPSLYAAYRNKEDLAEALVFQEAQSFLDGAAAVLRENSQSPLIAIANAVEYTLAKGEQSAIVRAILTRGASGEPANASLLSHLTIRAETILPLVNMGIHQWLQEVCPTHDPDDLQLVADSLVRLVISHLMSPAENPAATPANFARIAAGLLPELSPLVPASLG